MQTVQGLDPEELAGSVVAVPVVNPPMFQRRSGFLSPIDGLNLNRTAPGRADGTISEILAYVILNDVIGACQYHIDCHGGDLGEILWPYAGYALTGNPELDAQGEALARLYSPCIVALYREVQSFPDDRLVDVSGSAPRCRLDPRRSWRQWHARPCRR